MRIGVDDKHKGACRLKGRGEEDNEQRDEEGGDHGYARKARAADNAHADRPEEERQIHRILDGSSEAHDGERAHHTQRHDDIRLNGEDNCGGDHRDNDERNVEALVVEGVAVYDLVDKVDVDGDKHGTAYAHQHGLERDTACGVALHKCFFKQVNESHGSDYLLIEI